MIRCNTCPASCTDETQCPCNDCTGDCQATAECGLVQVMIRDLAFYKMLVSHLIAELGDTDTNEYNDCDCGCGCDDLCPYRTED